MKSSKKLRIAINGFGRIGKEVFRASFLEKYRNQIDVVVINVGHTLDLKNEALLFTYDSIHGKFPYPVNTEDNCFLIEWKRTHLFGSRKPEEIDWKAHDIDILLECTGKFRSQSSLQTHMDNGIRKVLISAPGEDVDATIVYGVNESILTGKETIVSNASCTTNCLAPLAKMLEDHIGILSGQMTTVHSYTSDQNLLDGSHTDMRRARWAALNIVPTKTGAAKAIWLVIPELSGKLKGSALRVPTPNVSLVELIFLPKRATSVEEINSLLQNASRENPEIIGYSSDPLVSSDFCGDARSCIFDPALTSVAGIWEHQMVKVSAWYDNETAYSQRMLDVAICM